MAINENGGQGFITVKDVARMLGVSKEWVRSEVKANRIPHVKLRNLVTRFDPEEIGAWVDERRRGPSPTAQL